MPAAPQAESGDAILAGLHVSSSGLEHAEAQARLERDGRNALPEIRPPGLLRVFLQQFGSPLIYVLLAAALVSLLEWLCQTAVLANEGVLARRGDG
jgi:Ca2+-transporting ATPase